MPADKKPTKTAAKAPPAAAPSKKKRKELPKIVRNWLAHRTTRPLWSKIRAQAKKKKVDPVSLIRKKKSVVEKKIGGEKNGGTRLVRLHKGRKYYPTEDRRRKPKSGRVCFKNHERKFKAGVEPGRVAIVLAGRHKGKRVVILKTLKSGLLLITGPHIINGCPLRRMHQNFVIITSTKLDIGGVKVPDNINDDYFKRARPDKKEAKKSKKAEGGDIFSKFAHN